MVTLNDAIETAEANLRVLAHDGIFAPGPLRLFYQSLQLLRDGDIYLVEAIRAAQEGCEKIIDVARVADDNGRTTEAAQLRGIVSDLAPLLPLRLALRQLHRLANTS